MLYIYIFYIYNVFIYIGGERDSLTKLNILRMLYVTNLYPRAHGIFTKRNHVDL